MSYTVLNSAMSSTLLSDPEVAGLFSADADLAAMLDFEAALAEAEAEAGVFSTGLAQQIIAACREFRPDMGRLNAGISRDGMAVPDLIRQLREAIGTEASKYLHFGATSQDVIDTSLTLRLQQVNQIFAPRLSNVCASLAHLDQRFGPRQMMARTRMQSALPILVSHRIDGWRTPLLDLSDDFGQVQAAVQALQFGGPVGTLDQLGAKAPEVRRLLA
jgi:3-carboxy-cis,cis-muconate cycloisomerase